MPKDGPQKPFMLMNSEASIHYMKEAENQRQPESKMNYWKYLI